MRKSVSIDIVGIIVVCLFSILAATIISLYSLANARTAADRGSDYEYIYENGEEEMLDNGVPFPRTNLHLCFGEVVSRPETAIVIARAILNDRRSGSRENVSREFDDLILDGHRLYFSWYFTAKDKGDVWVVVARYYLPPPHKVPGYSIFGPPDKIVTIHKADGKILSVYQW